MSNITIPISVGELIDKITILKIKTEKINIEFKSILLTIIFGVKTKAGKLNNIFDIPDENLIGFDNMPNIVKDYLADKI